MAAIAALLGPKLSTKTGALVSTATALGGCDYVALYFSAHWCPPCRRFTPVLGSWYERHGASKSMEVVFVSSDNSEAEFSSYFGEHKWNYAVPFGDKDSRRKLGQKFKVKGIPTLVILDKEGAVVTTEGVREISGDADASDFPYRPKSLADLLRGRAYTDKSGAALTWDQLTSGGATKILGLYFSAHWCGPCRGFTPQLADWYAKTQAAAAAGTKPAFDIVFVSSDRDEKAFDGYLAEMPWKALAFADRAGKEALSQACDVQGIPTLVFLDAATGDVITGSGREKVSSAPESFPWPPQPVDALDDAAGDYINDLPTAVLFTDHVTDATNEAAAVAAFTEVAREHFSASGGKPSEAVRFAIAKEGDEAIEAVRRFLGPSHMKDKDGAAAARVTILNVGEGERYCVPIAPGSATPLFGVPTADVIRDAVAAFLAGTVESEPIKG